VQYVTLNVATANIPLQTNQVVSLVGYDWNNQPLLEGNLPNGNLIVVSPFNKFTNGAPIVSTQLPQIFTGLTNIVGFFSTANYYGSSSWATFQITTPSSSNVVSNYLPADSIVIPASATGSVQIILESSPDLVNWTAASPGTYGASAGTNRFFRVRAVAN
jgi:hypothetical protein